MSEGNNVKSIEKEKIQGNKMGTMPVKKLVLSMSIPMMVANLVQALYNIVDSIFVSRISEKALTAVSLAFPIQILEIALGLGMCVGVNALLSKSLGEGNKDKASTAAVNGIYLSLFSYILFLVLGLTSVEIFYKSQTSDPEIIEYGIQYMTWICCLSFGIYMQFIFERLLQSTGKTMYTMFTQATGAIINMILDPILIFGYFGFPKLGVAGAAIATVFGQVIAATLAFLINIRKNKEISLDFRKYKLDLPTIGIIYRVGFPAIIMQSIGSVMNYFMNLILIGFTSTAVAVFGVYYKLQSFIFMPVFGLNNGIIPIIAYNYGAQNRKRVVHTVKTATVYAVGIMTVGLILFETIPGILLSIFDASDYMISIGDTALRIIAIHFPIAGICIVLGAGFQALGNGVYSMITSIMRQIVVLLPAAYLLALTGNLNMVWWAFPIAEGASLATTLVLYGRMNRKVIRNIPEGADI